MRRVCRPLHSASKEDACPLLKSLKSSGACIEAVAMDMSKAHVSAVTKHLPEADTKAPICDYSQVRGNMLNYPGMFRDEAPQ